MMPTGDRKLRMEALAKGVRYEYPTNFARKVLVDLILAEHTYARPSSLDPEFNRTHSTSLLFTKSQQISQDDEAIEGEVDVEKMEDPASFSVKYDGNTGKRQMAEMEECFRAINSDEHWQEEDQFSRSGWTRDQARLFDQAHKVLSTYRLARCCYEGHQNEQILRSLALEKSAKRFRNIAGAAAWDLKLMPWLHTTLVDGVNSYLFICYLELLQTLKAKIPQLIDKMIQHSTPTDDRLFYLNSPNIVSCLKRAWGPTPNIQSMKAKENQSQVGPESKLDNKPLLVLLPRGPLVKLSQSKRSKFWQSQLGSVGRVLPLNIFDVEKPENFAASAFLDNMIGVARSKISMFKSKFPGRPVILIGWSIGALLAFHLAALEQASGIVCLGYPSNGLDGIREAETYNISEIKCPVMFVIGTHSSTSSADFIEGLREKFRVDTNMLLVEGGNEMLQLTSSQKKRMRITQDMVDRLILDEVDKFIADVAAKSDASKDPSKPESASSSNQQVKLGEKKRKLKRTETDKAAIERKKPKVMQTQQQRTHAATKGEASKNKNKSKSEGSDALISTGTITTGATKAFASSASSVAGRGDGKMSIPSSISATTEGSVKTQVSKLFMKGLHGKYVEKASKKAKVVKRPTPAVRNVPAVPKKADVQTDFSSLQKFPTTSSILLSNTGAHLRLQDGRILRVSGVESQRTQLTPGISTASALRTSLVGHQTMRLSSTISIPNADQSKAGSVMPSTLKVIGQVSEAQSMVSTSMSQFTNLSVVGGSSSLSHKNTRVAADNSHTTPSKSGYSISKSVSDVSVHQSSPAPSTSQLSPSDLKYLNDLFSKSQTDSKLSGSSVDTSAGSAGNKQARSVPDSPISAKIGIGTLTNLADGSPPGSGTRHSPGSVTKHSPGSAVTSVATSQVPSGTNVLHSSQQSLSQSSSQSLQNNDHFRKAKSAETLSSKPISNTVTGPVSIKSTVSASLSFVGLTDKAAYLQTGTSAMGSSSSQGNIVNSKLTQSGSAVELSQFVKRPMLPLSSSAPSLATGRQPISIASISSSPAQLTLTSRQIQGPSARNTRSPQTITLHIPNSAMLKDHKGMKNNGSEIKLIGLLNQKHGSPMSSPIHFSVQSRSAPGSPQSQSPTIVFTSKPAQTTTTTAQTRVISLDTAVKSAGNPSMAGPKSAPAKQVPNSTPKSTAAETPKKDNSSIKVCKPGSIQTALIKSLTAASFSLKQKESIAHLLKNPSLIKPRDLMGQSEETVMQSKAHSSPKEKTGAVKQGATECVSFVSDDNVPIVVENRGPNKDNTGSELNGHGKVRDGKSDEASKQPRKHPPNATSDKQSCEKSGPSDVGNHSSVKGTDNRKLSSESLNEDKTSKEGNGGKQKRVRDTGDVFIEKSGKEDDGPTPGKRVAKSDPASSNGNRKITNAQNIEE